jgi:tryptophan synthase alpha chain
MTRIGQLFQGRTAPVLNVFCTAGFPKVDSTMEVMRALQQHGADMIELGMPYSDPLADGPAIQSSSATALQNGMHIELLFDQLRDMRREITIPVILMGYFNPVLQYGFEKFCSRAAAAGVDGLIIPDLPLIEFERMYGAVIRSHQLDFIFLVAPQTPDDRVRKLDACSSGFLYAVSSSALTGSEVDQKAMQQAIARLAALQLKNPVLVGFGIHDHSSFMNATRFSRGAIIGSAYIRRLENADDINDATKKFLHSILQTGAANGT